MQIADHGHLQHLLSLSEISLLLLRMVIGQNNKTINLKNKKLVKLHNTTAKERSLLFYRDHSHTMNHHTVTK